MLVLWTIWALCCVSTQTAMCSLARGSSTGGDRQGDGLTIAPSFRKLLQDAQPLVVGGEDAPEGRFPYACSLQAPGSSIHGCGGTLIAPKWVLTAAHCLTGEDSLGPTPVVHVGAFEIHDDSSAEVILAVEGIIHEMYTGNVDDGFDVALLRLQKPSKKQPVVLAQSEQRLGGGQLLAATGWGRRSKRGPFPKVLQLADQVAYVSNKNCEKKWPNLKGSMLCAFSNSQAVCDGDSGGPLLIADAKGGDVVSDGNPNLDLLVGIVSFGPTGCDSIKPDVYTRVSSFREWIDGKMGESPSETTTVKKCSKDCDKLDEDLYDAAGSGKANKVKELISKGADVSSTHEDLKFTPLHFAAQEGHVDIVEMLIEAGANVDAQNGEDATALYFAAQLGHLDVAKVLVKAGATVDLRRDQGLTPLIIAAFNNNLDVVEFLLESGANVDAQNDEEGTALYLAAQEGHLEVAKLLVKAGATVDLRRDTGETPLIIAAFNNNLDVAEFLVESGANVDAQDDEEATALYVAAQNGHLDVAKLLAKAGATVDLRTDTGATPLNIAAQEDKLDVAEFLVESGADVNANDNEDVTPLHAAAFTGNSKLVRLLLNNGAEIEAQDDFKQTPVFWAAVYGSDEAIEVLKNAGADLSIKDKDGTKIEDVICLCLEFNPGLACREGTCGEGEIERIKAILKG